MKFVIFGPPGSGKGTYASRLQTQLGIDVIAMGDIFREIMKEDTPLGRKVKAFVEKGNMPHLMFAGPAGTGKSSLSLAIVRA